MSELKTLLDASLANHLSAIQGCAEQSHEVIVEFAEIIAKTFEAGNKVIIFGNGGSACDAMHFAGECVGRFVNDRRPLPAIALTADPGIITAIGNDYGFEKIFERQLEAHARAGDCVIGVSTSGQSANVLRALELAKAKQMPSLLLTGERGKACDLATHLVAVPTTVTAHIQETHIWILQLMIAMIEKRIFKNQ